MPSRPATPRSVLDQDKGWSFISYLITHAPQPAARAEIALEKKPSTGTIGIDPDVGAERGGLSHGHGTEKLKNESHY